MKKSIALLLALIMALSLAACAGNTPTTPTDNTPVDNTQADHTPAQNTESGKPTMITIGCKNTIPSLSPFSTPSPFTNLILGEVYLHLAERAEAGDTEMTGCLAKSWTQKDGKTYDFELYDYITDAAGNPFTASDVKFCFEQAVLGGIAAANYVESVDVIDDTHFTLTLTTDSVGTLEQVCENVFMVTQASFEASADSMATDAVGVGPYKFIDYVAGSYVVLQKDENFWQTEELTPVSLQANVDVIRYDILTENTQMQGALQNGTIQAAFQVNNNLVSIFQADNRYETSPNPGGTFRFLVFNETEGSPFHDNQALREAVMYAIDGEGLNIACSEGLDSVPTNIGTSIYTGYNNEWNSDLNNYYRYDKEKAQELLAEAGYAPGELNVRLASNAVASVQSFFEMIATQLRDVGINATVDIYEANAYGEKQLNVINNEWDIALGYSISSIYQINQWSSWLDGNVYAHGLTQGGLDDPELQALVHRCQSPDWTQADLDELYQWLMDTAHVYHFLDNLNYHVASVEIDELFTAGSSHMTWRVGSFKLGDGWNHFYEG